MKISSKIIAIISSIVVVGSGGLLYYLTNRNSAEVLGWMDTNWLYRKAVDVDNISGVTLTNEDILIEIDTSTLVNAGKLQADCDDLRLMESDNLTSLDYWIEDDCNTVSTKIWVRIPSLPSGGTSIYMYYGNVAASAGSLSWGGNIILFADTTCPTGWTRASTLDGKFLYGSSTYGTTAGADSHAHSDATCTSSSISTTDINGTTGSIFGTSITHTHNTLKAGVNNNSSVLPPYKEMIMCYNTHFLLSTGLISMFNAAAPTGWTRFSSLDSSFPRAAATYGTTGGATTHTHTQTTGYTTGTNNTSQSSTTHTQFGTGNDGACIMNNGTKTIDSTAGSSVCNSSARSTAYGVNYLVTADVSAGATSVTTSATPTGIAATDEILIINLQGVTGNSANVGLYETAYVTSVDGSILNLDRALTNAYGGTTQKIMVQRIPNFTDVTVCGGNTGSGCTAAATLTTTAWNGTSKGLLAFRASGTITVKSGGIITVNDLGYTAGASGTAWTARAPKGESTFTSTGGLGGAGTTVQADRNGEAGVASGGGGGATYGTLTHGTGGSGTTTAGAGGGGGGGGGGPRSFDYRVPGDGYGGGGAGGGYGTGGEGGGDAGGTAGDPGTDTSSGAGRAGWNQTGNYGGGGGGGKTYGDVNLTKLFIGSGGGSGSGGRQPSGNEVNTGGGGGKGAGIIFFSTNTLTMEATGSILANGTTGGLGSGMFGGNGGAGAGGSISIMVGSATLQTSRITATGGAARTAAYQASGGAGGNGRIAIKYVTSITGSTSPGSTNAQISTYAASTHTHTSSSATVSTDSNVPSYLDMIFAKADSSVYVNDKNIIITSVLPPLGWDRFTALDAKLPRGAATYGGTGGTSTHTHTVGITTGVPSATMNGYGTGSSFADSTHTHSCSVTSNSVSNFPAYSTVIYAKRKVSQNVTILTEETPSGDTSWAYRRPIQVANTSGGILTNEDVLIDIDTSALINAGKLQSACEDIRFVDSNNSTQLSYWIEDDCNTASTKIWVRIPTLPIIGKTIYMYYGNGAAFSESLSWGGNIILFADTTCPTGWTRASTLDGKFLYGSSTYGTTAGADSHPHSDATCTSSSISTTSISGISGSSFGTSITHTHNTLKTLVNNNSSVLPPYREMIMCYNTHFILSTGLISMFNATAPTGWTRFSSLDSSFPRAAATYGTTGGATTHTHTQTTGYTTGTNNTSQSAISQLGTGLDGACIMNNGTKIIDSTAGSSVCNSSARSTAYGVNYLVTANVSAGATSVTTSTAPTGIVATDEILIINLQGVTGNSTTVGQYETAYVSSVNGSILNLDRALTNAYGGATQKIMVQRIPNFTDVTVCGGNTGSGCTVAATLTTTAWNATSKGLLAFRASGTVTVKSGGIITVNGLGYTGGASGTAWTARAPKGESTFTSTGGRGGAGTTVQADRNGEAGVASGGGGGATYGTYAHGTGGAGTTTAGSGGGGGGGGGGPRSFNYLVAGDGYGGGGGGGGYGTGGAKGGGGAGGSAGSDTSSGTGSTGSNGTGNYAGGGGGGKTYGATTLTTLFMGSGGGGGAGGRNPSGNAVDTGGGGGKGAGIIFISANTLTMEATGSILANGAAGGAATAIGNFGSGGGGGAGGSISIIVGSATLQTSRITATGGAGGGGGQGGAVGGVGRIAIKYTTSPTGSTSPASTNTQMVTFAANTHTHTSSSATVSTDSNVPSYLDMIFAKADSSVYVNDKNIIITSVLQPLGWDRFTALDAKFPRGSATYGGTGGTTTHTHTVAITTGTPSATMCGYDTGSSFADSTHTHSCSITSNSVSNFPAYSTVIYTKRKTSQQVTILAEESYPDAPSDLLCEGEDKPESVVDTTPEFSAIFSDDNASDTGNYYQIEVNTTSDYTGSVMWDSTKTAFGTPIVNGARSSDISYAGSTLQWGTKYYWRIKFWDNKDLESIWSESYFTMNIRPNQPTLLLADDVENNIKTTAIPYFSAIFSDANTLDTGDYYQIEVNTALNFAGTIMWDSTKTAFGAPIVNGARSSDITYDGSTLSTNTTYYWRIKFWDSNDLESILSETAFFIISSPPNAPTDLEVDGQTNPTILYSINPSFTAIYSDDNEDSAMAYQIEVNTSALFNGTTVWDTGKTSTTVLSGDRSPLYIYNGLLLNNSLDVYYWRIKFWDTDDTVGPWSEVAEFIDGLAFLRMEGLKLGGLKID